MIGLIRFLALFFVFSSVSACVPLAVGAGGGYVIHDESTEGDGNFDPLENLRGKGDGKN